ncbi:MAG: heavy-metal-associated domain-containing protein [Alphaproteobacteria bacterium]|nr:heavy-metal-associated domain-containing protein [Alphaproteobacteria bacterium]
MLRSNDLTCPTCVASLEEMLRAIEGVESATVQFTSDRFGIQHDPERANTAA